MSNDDMKYSFESRSTPRKIRINPLYILLTLVALLPFYVIYLRRSAEEAKKREYKRVHLDRLSVELPGDVQISRVMKGGLHYVASAGANMEVFAALMPILPQSEIAVAFDNGSLAMAQTFVRIMPQLQFEQIGCQRVGPGHYALTGLRENDKWQLAAHVVRFPDSAGIILAITPNPESSGRIAKHMLESLRLEPDEEKLSHETEIPQKTERSPSPPGNIKP